MDNNKLVSIIIPVFNVPAFLTETKESMIVSEHKQNIINIIYFYFRVANEIAREKKNDLDCLYEVA